MLSWFWSSFYLVWRWGWISLCSQSILKKATFQGSNGCQKQECIPVGCVPPAHYCTGGLCLGGLPDRDLLPWTETPRMETLPLWTDKHLWKHNLRKLRLRALISSWKLASHSTAHITPCQKKETETLSNAPLNNVTFERSIVPNIFRCWYDQEEGSW